MILLNIIGWACLAHMAVDFLQSFGFNFLDRKPLNCDMCMGFWLPSFYFISEYGSLGLAAAGASGVLADLIFRIKNRL